MVRWNLTICFVQLRIAYEWTEDFVIKYLWSAAGYCLISIPVLFTRTRSVGIQASMPNSLSIDDAVADRTESELSYDIQNLSYSNFTSDRIGKDYISSRRLLLSLADAGGRLMYAYKDVLELAGYTTRLYTLLSTLHSLPTTIPFTPSPDTLAMKNIDVVLPISASSASQLTSSSSSSLSSSPTVEVYDDDSEFERASDIVTDSDSDSDERKDRVILVRGLNLELRAGAGEHLMITGTNGVGKTAVARVAAGLWAASSGELIRPALGVSEVFVVPQRAYMVAGTLLDQLSILCFIPPCLL